MGKSRRPRSVAQMKTAVNKIMDDFEKNLIAATNSLLIVVELNSMEDLLIAEIDTWLLLELEMQNEDPIKHENFISEAAKQISNLRDVVGMVEKMRVEHLPQALVIQKVQLREHKLIEPLIETDQ